MKAKIRKEWTKLFKRCNECRKNRKEWDKEKNKEGEYCPPFPGCGNFKENVDVLLLTEGHSGGHKEQWKERDFEKLSSMKKHVYTEEFPFPSFHIFAMRKLINRIEKELNLSWFLTDIWKCLVYKDKKNRAVSFNYCKDFLIKEINILKPKIIILFGVRVNKFFLNISKDISYDHKEIKSLFPSQSTADKWLGKEKIFWEDKIIREIKHKLKNEINVKCTIET